MERTEAAQSAVDPHPKDLDQAQRQTQSIQNWPFQATNSPNLGASEFTISIKKSDISTTNKII